MNDQVIDHNLSELPALRPNNERAKQLMIILAIIIFIDVASIISSYLQIQLLNDFNLGLDVSDAQISSNDNRESAIGIIALIFQIAAIILFIRWFRRAYYNVGLLEQTEYSEGWAAGGWFIPFLNWVRPYQIMKEIWVITSRKVGLGSGSSIVGMWWFLWIVTSLVANVTFRLSMRAESVDDFINASYTDILSSGLEIPLAIIAILMIKQYNEMNDQLVQTSSIEY